MVERSTYRIVRQPAESPHGHPVLVFDGDGRLHFHLTVFAKEAVRRTSAGTAHGYLSAILPFFAYLDTDGWQRRAARRWDSPAHEVRQAIEDYLAQRLRCEVRPQDAGGPLVARTAGTPSTIRSFLAGLKLFYRAMQAGGYYPGPNPLVEPVAAAIEEVDRQLAAGEFPRMPELSGVTPPGSVRRLTDSYYRLVGERWVPRVVDDPDLPGLVYAAGQRRGWGLREECVLRLLFGSGGRVSEVVGLTLGDWVARGCGREATAFSKGSHGRRVKFLRFTSDTANLLRRYVDGERRRYDPQGYGLDDYRQRAAAQGLDLHGVPLFLTRRRTPLSAKNFRDNFWTPACRAAGLDVDIHQARHWYVTRAVRRIYETTPDERGRAARLQALIAYMQWRRGPETLDAYEHYFTPARHAEVADELHDRLDATLQRQLADLRRGARSRQRGGVTPGAPVPSAEVRDAADDPEFAYLRRVGGGCVDD
jgi:integrase